MKYEAEEKGRESEGMDSDSGEAGHSESEAVSEGAGNQGAGTDVPEGLEIRVEFDSMKSYPDLEGQGTDEKPGIERETETGVFGDSGIAESSGRSRDREESWSRDRYRSFRGIPNCGGAKNGRKA